MVQHILDDKIRVTVHTYYNNTSIDIREFRADKATIIGVTLSTKELRQLFKLRKELRRDIQFANTLLPQYASRRHHNRRHNRFGARQGRNKPRTG